MGYLLKDGLAILVSHVMLGLTHNFVLVEIESYMQEWTVLPPSRLDLRILVGKEREREK
jgi:hypothetical protein